MDLRPDGKSHKMHSTILPGGHVQHMVFQVGDCQWDSLIPIPDTLISGNKGMKRVLQGRELWRDGLKKQCGAPKLCDGIETRAQCTARPALDRREGGEGLLYTTEFENQSDFLNHAAQRPFGVIIGTA
jgi:hypothetical protein